MPNMLTIRQAAERLKAEGLPVSEYWLRILVKRGEIPVRYAGAKALIYFPHIVRYLQCVDGSDNAPGTVAAPGVRRVDV